MNQPDKPPHTNMNQPDKPPHTNMNQPDKPPHTNMNQPDKPPHTKRVNEDNSDEFISANSTDFEYDTTASYFHRNIQMT